VEQASTVQGEASGAELISAPRLGQRLHDLPSPRPRLQRPPLVIAQVEGNSVGLGTAPANNLLAN
jgi:hypothetical protein